MTIRELRRQARRLFGDGAPVPSPTPLLDAECILAHILGLSRSRLLSLEDTSLTLEEEKRFAECVEKRRRGLPVAYITGSKEFYGSDFLVTPDVLIPKADTELLVEKALELVRSYKEIVGGLEIADMCTGSGCIALAVLLNSAETQINLSAIDISEAALKVARINTARLLASETAARINWVQSDLFAALPAAQFDIILANPPYIPSALVDALLLDGRSEPRLALDGGAAGLDCIERLIAQSVHHLKNGGSLLLETGEYNHRVAAALLAQHGFREVISHTDLAGSDRLLIARKNSN